MRIAWNCNRKSVRLKLEKGEDPRAADLRTILSMMAKPSAEQRRAELAIGQTVDAYLLSRMRTGEYLSRRQVELLADYFAQREAAGVK